MNKYEKLFEPIYIGDCEIKNRYFMAPMGAVGMVDTDGAYTDKAINYYSERAKGGTGLIITGVTKVDGEVEPFSPGGIGDVFTNPAAFLRSAKRMCERVQAYDSKIFLQLGFGFGRVMVPFAIEGGAGKVAPSPISNRWNEDVHHREMTTKEVEQVIESTIRGAAMAKVCGFDGVEVHAVHEGYLLDQFTMDVFNQRTDKYGGSFENRFRAPVEIVQGIKKVCGEDFPVTLRYSVKSFIKDIRQGGLPGEDFDEMGRDVKEGIKAAKYLEEAGYDALNLDAGSYDAWYWAHPPMYFDEGMYLEFAEAVSPHVDIPIMTAGRMDNPNLAVEQLERGNIDMVGLGRPLLADPQLPNKVRRNRIDEIRPCLSCHDGCLGRLKEGLPISCAVNPTCANEEEFALVKTTNPKEVLIIGGGVAGMETARVLKLRGHNPRIIEASDKLGGSLIPGGMPPFKNNDHKLVNWYKQEIRRLDIEVELNTIYTKDMIEVSKEDIVIVATGSIPIELNLEGENEYPLLFATEALEDIEKVEDKVVIIGAGLVGAELGLWLAQEGREVTIVEMTDEILGGEDNLCFANSDMLKDLLNFEDVEILKEHKAKSVDGKGITIVDKNNEEKYIEADTVISAVGYIKDDYLYNDIKFIDKDIYKVGDSKEVNNIMYAIWDAHQIAREL